MFSKSNKHKGGTMFFATVNPGEGHFVYLSAYGEMVSELLEKYMEDQREDYEELFTKWDEAVQKAISEPGFSEAHEVEGGYLYITTFQNGIGISEEEENMVVQRKTANLAPKNGADLPDLRSDMDNSTDDDDE